MRELGCVVFSLLVTVFLQDAAEAHSHHDQRVVCYVGSWAVYRPSKGKFNIEDIDPLLCTHLIYAFAGLDENTLTIASLDPNYDIDKGAFSRFVGLKSKNPSLKVLIAIGGWTEGSIKYSNMSMTSASRKKFIDSVTDFLQKHQFDGLDLDWEYPANRGGVPEDRENYILLVQELRRRFDLNGWMLTAAFGAGKSVLESAYDIPRLVPFLDSIHLMTYDFHGKWEGKTGHNSPLYHRDDEPEEQRSLNVEWTVKKYLSMGVPRSKLVLGLGFYGRTFLLQDINNPGIEAPSQKTAFAGPYTREDGFLGYNEICEKQQIESGQWKTVWQKGHQAPYMFKDDMWVGYDDDFSIGLKVKYAQQHGLAGVMVWSIDTDDFKGICGRAYPLLNIVNDVMVKEAPSRPTEKTPIHKPGLDVDHKDILDVDYEDRMHDDAPKDTKDKPDLDLGQKHDVDVKFDVDYDNTLDRHDESRAQTSQKAGVSGLLSNLQILIMAISCIMFAK